MTEIAQTADHALRVLEELANGPQSVAEISPRLGLHRSVVHRLLTTLAARDFVLRQGNRYHLGPALVRLAAQTESTLRSVARPVLDELSERTGETVVLHLANGSRAVVLDQAVATRHLVQVAHQISSHHHLSAAAGGRAILAFLPETQAARILADSADPAGLTRSVRTIRRRGFAKSHDELQPGVHALAAPLRDASGTAFGSLAMLVPTGRAQSLDLHAAAVLAAAEQIEGAYRPAPGHAGTS
ncbi:IclR family transcriptional regulator [Pimelobacter simplex]|uniref:IclR family transcriptional regulator n=1 Tax=Nocardioides simplex TaxID=2045 RepID=UPI003AACE1D2